MFRDDDLFPMATRHLVTETHDADPRVNTNDDFDDVFGSAPSSPSFHAVDHDPLEDSSYISGDDGSRPGNAEISDIPRLKEKHQTEGYRDGVTAGKATSVQAGFDEGYGLGAVLGLQVGGILGILEGLAAGVSKMEDLPAERVRLWKLLSEARSELKTENVFGQEWWGEDGIWRFEVEGEGIEGKDVLFPDVAKAHPLVKKWNDVVSAEIKAWGLDLAVMDTEDIDVKSLKKDLPQGATVLGTAKAELNW